MPKARQNRSHSSSPLGPRSCGTVTTWTRSGGSLAPHGASTAGRSIACRKNHVWPRSTLVEEAAEGPLAALLDRLLPRGGQLAAEVARGVDDVDLVAGEVVHRLGDLVGLGAGEDLVADDDVACGAVGRVGPSRPRRPWRGRARRPSPGRAGRARPGSGRRRRRRTRSAGMVTPWRPARRALSTQPVLQVGRPGLGGADVEVDDAAHGADCARVGWSTGKWLARDRRTTVRRWTTRRAEGAYDGARAGAAELAGHPRRWWPRRRRGRRRARCRGRSASTPGPRWRGCRWRDFA